jgi:hypothetical protein
VTSWDQRELCPDGACVGVIGDDGLCKVCGRAAQNWADDRKRGLKVEEEAAEKEEDDDDEDEHEDDDEHDGEHEDDRKSAVAVEDDDAAYEWSRRRLCSDGACIGVIGANGKCTVCGSAS